MPRLVDVPPQKVYGSVPLMLPIIKTSEAEAIWLYGQPQIYDKDYPLDYSGLDLNPPWWANTGAGGGLNGVGGGNVALLPHESGGLGAVVRRGSVAVKKSGTALNRPVPSSSDAGLGKRRQACITAGGTFDASTGKCTTRQQQEASAAAACRSSGGVWNSGSKSCGPSAAQAKCTADGGSWSNNACTPSQAQTACASGGGKWSNGTCIQPPSPQVCPQVQKVCPTGQVASYGAPPGCVNTCVPDPNYQDPRIQQCQSTGGYWDGSACISAPVQPQYGGSGGGGGGGIAPPMMPDPMTSPSQYPSQPQFPMQQSQSQYGGGSAMQQGDGGGGQINEQAFDIPRQDEQSEESEDSTSKETSAGVASSNVLESISKLFSGMGGTACGVNSVPPWVGVSGLMGGGNAPPIELVAPRYYEARGVDPLKSSTVVGVLGGSAVLVAVGAAIYFWSKAKK